MGKEQEVAYIEGRNSGFPTDKLYVSTGVAFCESSKFFQIDIRTAWNAACMNPENIFTASFIRWLHIQQSIETT
jgi:hypothetical protein